MRLGSRVGPVVDQERKLIFAECQALHRGSLGVIPHEKTVK